MNKLFKVMLFLLSLPYLVFSANAQYHVLSDNTLKQMQQDNNTIKFAIVGDYGKDNDDEKRVADRIKARNPDFILTLGDNNYPNGCWDTIDKNIGKYYANYIGNYKGHYGQGSLENRFYPATGNHDWNALDEDCLYNGRLPYLEYFSLPGNGLYYDFVKGSVHFFAIDSDDDEPDGNEKHSMQYEWLKEKLQHSQECFNVVYFHHPPYTSSERGPVKNMRWDFHKLGADVVLSGHDHLYERIMQHNIVYFINGLGGAGLDEFDDKTKGSKYRYNKKHGYMMGYANDNRLILSFFNVKGDKKDGIELTKSCPKFR